VKGLVGTAAKEAHTSDSIPATLDSGFGADGYGNPVAAAAAGSGDGDGNSEDALQVADSPVAVTAGSQASTAMTLAALLLSAVLVVLSVVSHLSMPAFLGAISVFGASSFASLCCFVAHPANKCSLAHRGKHLIRTLPLLLSTTAIPVFYLSNFMADGLAKYGVLAIAVCCSLYAGYNFNQYEVVVREVLMETLPAALLSLMPGSDATTASEYGASMELRVMQMMITRGVQAIHSP
jgi:hypothetical protein